MTAKNIRDLLKKLKSKRKGIQIDKYFGKIKAKDHPQKLQEKLRNEWE